jgi:hypothetical protein
LFASGCRFLLSKAIVLALGISQRSVTEFQAEAAGVWWRHEGFAGGLAKHITAWMQIERKK